MRLHGLDTVSFLDNTDSNMEKAQLGDVAIASQTDSAYLNTWNTVELSDPKMCRRIRLAKANSLTTVVWNPWREKASELRDLADGEWPQCSLQHTRAGALRPVLVQTSSSLN